MICITSILPPSCLNKYTRTHTHTHTHTTTETETETESERDTHTHIRTHVACMPCIRKAGDIESVRTLQVPHPILIRKYQQNEFTSLWFTTYIWGVLYLRNQSPPYFDAAHIRLFTISYVDA